jgi:hypothetical protein
MTVVLVRRSMLAGLRLRLASVIVGRFGAIASSYLGAWALDAGGPPFFFASIAATMVLATASLVLIRNHVPGAG